MLTRWQKRRKTKQKKIAPGFYNLGVDGIAKTRIKSEHAHLQIVGRIFVSEITVARF